MKFKPSIARRVTLALTGVMMLAIAMVMAIAFLIHKAMEQRLVGGLAHHSIDGTVYVRFDALGQDELTQKFGLILLAIALVFMVLSYWLGGRVAKWVVSPLQTLTDQLTQWVPGASSFRVSRSDEIGRLKDAFNRVQHQVDESIAREREYAANLHHEIRTPLARIRSDCELMLHRKDTQTDAGRRLRRMMRSVDDIADALEGVYDIARAQQGPSETVNLRECVDEVFAQWASDAEAAQLTLGNKVDSSHTVTVNNYALVTVVRNLLRNAIAHAAPAALQILSVEDGIVVVDSGAGIAPDDLPYVFDRYHSAGLVDQASGHAQPARNDQRTGLGLAIARQVCATHGWNITVQSPVADGKGTAFHLRF